SKKLVIRYVKISYPLLFIFCEHEGESYYSIVNIEKIRNGSQVNIEDNFLTLKNAIFTDFQLDLQGNLFLGAYVFIDENDANKGPRFVIVKIMKDGKIDKNFGNNGILLFRNSHDTSVDNGGRFFIKDGLFYGYAVSYPEAYFFIANSEGKINYFTLTKKEGLDLFNFRWNYFLINNEKNFFLFALDKNNENVKII
ncbi:MAG: hypothetical protein ACK4ZM_00995, partial [bacterium]